MKINLEKMQDIGLPSEASLCEDGVPSLGFLQGIITAIIWQITG